ncbi:hypothetical protein D9M70_464290 [compost metagenome]
MIRPRVVLTETSEQCPSPCLHLRVGFLEQMQHLLICIALNRYRPNAKPNAILTLPLILQPLLEAALHVATIAGTNCSMRALRAIQLIEALQFVEIVDGKHIATTVIGDGIHPSEVVAGGVFGLARGNHPVLEQLADVLAHRAFSSRVSDSGRRSWPEVRRGKRLSRSWVRVWA